MFQISLAFLTNIFSYFNGLNLKFQGVGVNILRLRDKIAAFIAKLQLWKTKMQSGHIVALLPILNKMTETNDNNNIIQSEADKQLD